MAKDKEGRSGFATAALVLGIIGIVLSFIPIVNNAAFILGALALIFGLISLFKKRKVATSVVAIILAILAMVITIAMQKSFSDAIDKTAKDINTTLDNASGKNSDAILKNDAKVEFGKFIVAKDQYGLESSTLPVTVTNKTSEKVSYSVQVEALDSNGARIADDTVYIENLGSGQSQKSEAFKLVTSDKYDALKSATFKVASISKS